MGRGPARRAERGARAIERALAIYTDMLRCEAGDVALLSAFAVELTAAAHPPRLSRLGHRDLGHYRDERSADGEVFGGGASVLPRRGDPLWRDHSWRT